MHPCPHCEATFEVRDLPHRGLWDSYRACPNCGGRFTVDRDTRYRQALFIVVALISLAFSVMLYVHGTHWLVPALASYAGLVGLLFWGNARVRFVPYDGD